MIHTRSRYNFSIWTVLSIILINLFSVQAKRNLIATSLVSCIENSQLTSNSFSVVFDPDDRSLHYNLDLTTEIDSYIYADIDVYAYGFKIITKNVDLCDINWKQFCPVHPGRIEIESIEYISESLVSEIPGIAYQVPDIDAYAKVKVFSANTSNYLACIQVYFSNGKTVAQTGVKWATAVVAGIGLLLSALLSSFGNSTAASHISANTMSLFLYFQSVVVVAMEHVHRVPPIASSWSENLAWSMGLIQIHFMQRIFRWFIDSTGGTSSLYLTSTTMSVLAQRSLEFTLHLIKRADNILYGNRNTVIFRGIKRMGYLMGIENTAIVATGFTFFILCGYVLAGFVIVCKYGSELLIRAHWMKPSRFFEFRVRWRIILKGALLRYIYIGFVQLTILSFWEFTEVDSAAVIVIACLLLILSVGLMGWCAYRTMHFARKSIKTYNNPAALLYGDDYVLHKYGFFYTMFNASHYWWNNVLLSYMFVKALFIGFAQASGMTQALALFILDLFYFIAIIYYKPYLDKPTNIINILISTVTLVNSFLFLFFSDLFNQNYTVSAIMGWIFFIMNAAFSFILLMMILAFTLMIIFSKNPDLRFKPAKDDRTSFQRRNVPINPNDNEKSALQELIALGDVAKDHESNWENGMVESSNVETNTFSSIHDITSSSDVMEKYQPLSDNNQMIRNDSPDDSNRVSSNPFKVESSPNSNTNLFRNADGIDDNDSSSSSPSIGLSPNSNLNPSDDDLINPFREEPSNRNLESRDSFLVESQSYSIPVANERRPIPAGNKDSQSITHTPFETSEEFL